MPTQTPTPAELLAELRQRAEHATSDVEIRAVTSQIANLTRRYRVKRGIGLPETMLAQATELDSGYVNRPHIEYLSTRLAQAVRDVEQGRSRNLSVSMPPRSGKSTLLSLYGPLWLLRRHPEWKVVLASHDGNLTAAWARKMRQLIESKPSLGIALAPDGGAGSHWETEEGGGLFSTSTRGGLTGRGARVLIIDDPIKDFVDAHSPLMRQNLWDWWLSVALTRLEPPSLVLVVMTRWHEDDFIGRLLSTDHEGDPATWEQISLPALADRPNDPLGRTEGEPLLSPLLDETTSQALGRWDAVRRSVGTYTFSAMYQQRPAPAKGAIFDSGWWRYWTTDQSRATEDGRVVYLDPSAMIGARWLDSWDCAFKGSTHADGKGGSNWVVGQRWARLGANRYLIAQQRGRWSFTRTITAMERWAAPPDRHLNPCGNLVHERLIESAANGPAIMDTLKDRISGLKPIQATVSKEARARAVTPEIESGNVLLPHPGDPGNEWVQDLLSELRNFPNDANDDQVDSLTQALQELRESGRGQLTVPGSVGWRVPRSITSAAHSDLRRSGRRF